MASTALNEPCFCGNGKRYEDCCFLEDLEEVDEKRPSSTVSWLKEAIEGRSFNSLQEVQETLDRVVSVRNNAPQDDFCGLSPAQIHRLLYDPFGEESLAHYNLELTNFPEIPILSILKHIITGLSQGGLKMTTKGNLPVDFSRSVALSYYGEEGFREKTRFGRLRREQEWGEIHTVRLTGELAGFIKKEKGRFKLTRKGERLLSQGLNGESFLDLFRAYTWKFNWAYRDSYPQMDIIQKSFLFTLFCLHRFGDEARPGEFYADLFLRTFPMVSNELPRNHPYWNPEKDAKKCYSLRVLERFASFFGLASIHMPPRHLELPLEVRKEPLLDLWVSFGVE